MEQVPGCACFAEFICFSEKFSFDVLVEFQMEKEKNTDT